VNGGSILRLSMTISRAELRKGGVAIVEIDDLKWSTWYAADRD
jgi:hypothetical protein